MAVRRILTVNNPADLVVLKTACAPVPAVTDTVRALMDEMLETMYEAPGIGLAAVQIGDLRRVVVMDLGDREGVAEDADETERRHPRHFVNPEIVWASDERSTYEEGCLSLPEYFDAVERPARVRIRFLDYDGQTREEEAAGLYATCIQHEIDHLNGVLFVDHLSRLRRERAMIKVRKYMRDREAA